MRTFTDTAAQGDILIQRVDSLPDDLTPCEPFDGRHIVTHSETGHHHVMACENVAMFRAGDEFVSYLDVRAPTPLEHLRPHDTHEPIMFSPGKYQIRRQREYTPEGFRRVED